MFEIVLSESELVALEHMSHRALAIYLHGLKRRIDPASGVAGITNEITRQSLRDSCEVRPPLRSRFRTYRASDDEIISSLTQLERAGLIQRLSRKNKFASLIFFLPLALTIHSVVDKDLPECEYTTTPLPCDDYGRGELHTIPDNFEVLEMHRAYCRKEGLPDPDMHIESFINKCLERGSLSRNWAAAFYVYLAQ